MNFPEISMYKMGPWGGYGANPLPLHLQSIWDSLRGKIAGGFPYSEGIFEDLNKAVNLQHYWNGRAAMETVREYIAYEFSPDAVKDVEFAVARMEEQHPHGWEKPKLDKAALQAQLFPPDGSAPKLRIFNAQNLKNTEERRDILRGAEKSLPDYAKKSWRWRILKLRAEIDAELERSGGTHTEWMDECFGELNQLYHAENGYDCVAPPSRKNILRY